MAGRKREQYYFVFFTVISQKHSNYHHAIIKTDDPRKIKDINTDHYQYYMRSYLPLDNDTVESRRLKDPVYEGLIRDGESLWKRMQK